MSADDARDLLAAAILDGTPVDWAAAEKAAGDTGLPFLEHLKTVAAVADVHRIRTPVPDHTSDPTDPPPALWGHLRLLDLIGRGTFGEVYRAWDTRLDREVALKLLPIGTTSDDRMASSIIHEGRLLARVRHNNVVTIYGADQIGDRIGLWMEFVRGHTLEQTLQRGRTFTAAEAAGIGLDLCRAVSAVHSAGLLHRDIKAHNVMLADDGRVVLMDFGTGRELADGSVTDLAGTPLYLAPEVLLGQPATVQSDLYSLGVLLYRVVSGAYPVQGQTIADLRRAHETSTRTELRAARPDLAPRLTRVIERAIDPKPERRYPNADALSRELALTHRSRIVPFIYGAAVVAAVVVAIWLVWRDPDRQSVERIVTSTAPAVVLTDISGKPARSIERPVIAVLPFKNLSSAPGTDPLVDGLTVEILQQLAVIKGLEVRSQTSSFMFKNTPLDVREVGERLGANLILEGAALKSGDTLRINAKLVVAADDVSLWADQFERKVNDASDVLDILDEIARGIVDKLRLTLGRGQRRYDMMNLDAYELYLKARGLVDRRGVPNSQQAAELYEQVIRNVPQFAPAHSGLANAYALMSMPSGGLSFEVAHAKMRPAAVKALELDPLLADAHAAMGWVYSREFDWAAAEQEFQRAIDLDPSLTQTYTSYSISTLQPLGKQKDALRLLRVALQHDPLSLDVQREIGVVQLFAGSYDEAIQTFERVRRIDPDFPFVAMYLARALTHAGRVGEAFPLLESLEGRNATLPRAGTGRGNPGTFVRPGRWLARPYVMTGRRAEVETLVAERPGSAYNQVIMHAALGDRVRTLEALEQMAVVEPHIVGFLLRAPELAEYRGDPRFVAFRKRFGLP